MGTKYAVELAPIISPFYRFVMFIGFPVIWIFERITKIFSKDRQKKAMTDEEVDSFIDM
ncbi:MAG: DUF21 domain-containing protein [Candidatus Peribacteria bacterium]|nr:DUF21 domain-containing protein [Candidatus Peribacteria bacterium]